jgi:hypothetical protein
MLFCICTLPKILVVILSFFLLLKYWKHKDLRPFSILLLTIVLIDTYVFYGYSGFVLLFISFLILRKQSIYVKNRERLLKYFSK